MGHQLDFFRGVHGLLRGGLTYRRRLSYNTKSNQTRVSKTPGGKLVVLYTSKAGKVARCGDCGTDLLGLKSARPKELAKMSKRQKTVTRAYGGSRCSSCVRERVVRAFLTEEQKIVKRVIKSKGGK